MAERSIAAVLKTVEGYTSGGSNPSLSANQMNGPALPGIFVIADGTSSLGPDVETKMGVSDSERPFI